MSVPPAGEILIGPPAPTDDTTAINPHHPADRAVTCYPLTAPTILDDFLAQEDIGITIPPDTMGAVGPAHLLVHLNDRVRIQNRDGTTISTVFDSTFWAPASPVNPFDPVVIYDELSARFIAVIDSDRRAPGSAVLFAITRTSDPTGTWDFYSLDADPANLAWADFPRVGYNNTWFAITQNMFAVANDAFLGVSMWVIDKASALVPGGPITFTRFDYGFDNVGGAYGFVLVPASTHDSAETTLWIVDSSGWTSGGVQLHRLSRITGTGPAPNWTVAPGGPFPGSGFFLVSTNYSPSLPDSPQLGAATLIEANDPRLLDADFRNGALWYTHCGGLPLAAPVRTSAFWYQMNTSNLSAPFFQSGLVDNPGEFYTFPSIAVNCADDMMLGFSRASPSIFIEAAFTHRLAADTTGTTRPIQTLKPGEDSYVKDFGSGRFRWGDYSATVVDPIDDRCLWTIQEYAALDVGPNPNDDRWSTWWGRLCDLIVCVGDLDADGDNDVFDFGIFAPAFGTSLGDPGFNPNADLDNNNTIDVFDFGIYAPDFGCPN